MIRLRFALALLLLVGACQARAADQELVRKARRSFDATARGKFMLGYLHVGAEFRNYRCLAAVGVTDATGKLIPGYFCLRYQFVWPTALGDNTTTIDVHFDDKGRFRGVNNEKSTSILSEPYVLANAGIQVLGAVILEAFKNDLKPADKKVIQGYIDNPNARGLMTFALQLQYNVLGR